MAHRQKTFNCPSPYALGLAPFLYSMPQFYRSRKRHLFLSILLDSAHYRAANGITYQFNDTFLLTIWLNFSILILKLILFLAFSSSIPMTQPLEHSPLPEGILGFINGFMRAINTARLYAVDHALFTDNIQQLQPLLEEAMSEREFLFLGCAKDSIFFEGDFYQSKDPRLKKFYDLSHSLRISHLLIDKNVTTEDLGSFVRLLAGAQQGQGEEVSSTLVREGIKHIKLGLLDYTIFNTVQMAATQLADSSEDESIWRQLIIGPVPLGTFDPDSERTKKLTNLTENSGELKDLLVGMDKDMRSKKNNLSVTQRAGLLSNFLQNLGDTLTGIDPERRGPFAQQALEVLDSLGPQLKTQILGSVSPEDDGNEEQGTIHEIIEAMPDEQFIYLLNDALREAGANSVCFNNLFNRALKKYPDPYLFLTLIKRERQKVKKGKKLKHWKHLERLMLLQQQIVELNEQYKREIEALATSMEMEKPMVEEDELARLIETITPEALMIPKAKLIINLISRAHSPWSEALVPHFLNNLGAILDYFFKQNNFPAAAALLRAIFLSLGDFPQETLVRKTMGSLASIEEIRALLEYLMKACSTFDPKETAHMDAVSQLYPEKAGAFFIDTFIEMDEDDNPKARWLTEILIGLGPRLARILAPKLEVDSDHTLKKLLELAAISTDQHLAPVVEPLLEHKHNDIRLTAINTLGSLQAEGSIPHLAQIMRQKARVKSKKTKSLQLAAAHALAQIGTDSAHAILKEIAEESSGELQAVCRELA